MELLETNVSYSQNRFLQYSSLDGAKTAGHVSICIVELVQVMKDNH